MVHPRGSDQHHQGSATGLDLPEPVTRQDAGNARCGTPARGISQPPANRTSAPGTGCMSARSRRSSARCCTTRALRCRTGITHRPRPTRCRSSSACRTTRYGVRCSGRTAMHPPMPDNRSSRARGRRAISALRRRCRKTAICRLARSRASTRRSTSAFMATSTSSPATARAWARCRGRRTIRSSGCITATSIASGRAGTMPVTPIRPRRRG